jgi:hypothetical protein
MAQFYETNSASQWCLGINHISDERLILRTRQETLDFSNEVCALIESSGLEQERAILVDEWHTYFGYVNGLADLVDASINEVEGIIKLVKPQKALVVHTAFATSRVIPLIPSIDVLNMASIGLINRFLNTDSINNVTTLSFDEFEDGTEKYEFVLCYLGPATYVKEFFQKMIDKVAPGGVLLIHNSADFAAAYDSPRSPGNLALQQVRNTEAFDIVHYPTPVSFTLCIRKDD